MHRVRISGYPPTSVDSQIAVLHPAQFLQLLQKRCELRLGFRITHQRADPPHPLGLLRARRHRPCRRAAEQRDELAPLHHSITLMTKTSRFLYGLYCAAAIASINPTMWRRTPTVPIRTNALASASPSRVAKNSTISAGSAA